MHRRGTAGVLGRLSLLVAALALLVAGNGCGGGGSSDASADGSAEAGIPDSPPKLEPLPRLPPKRLVVKDLHEGDGAKAEKNDRVRLHYYGILWDGAEYSNSWNYQAPPVFRLGEPRLLHGLTLAVPGMREGGSRELLIPHNLVFAPGVRHVPLGVLDALRVRVYLVKVLPEA